MKTRQRWALAFVGCLIVGMFGGAARALDKTKTLANPSLGDHYPQDHSQPGTGIGEDSASTFPPGGTPEVMCKMNDGSIRRAQCYKCSPGFSYSSGCRRSCDGDGGCGGDWGGVPSGNRLRLCLAGGPSCSTAN